MTKQKPSKSVFSSLPKLSPKQIIFIVVVIVIALNIFTK